VATGLRHAFAAMEEGSPPATLPPHPDMGICAPLHLKLFFKFTSNSSDSVIMVLSYCFDIYDLLTLHDCYLLRDQ